MFGGRSPKRAKDHPTANYSTFRTIARQPKHPIMRAIVYGLVILFVSMALWGIIRKYVYNAPNDNVGIDLPIRQEQP